MEITHASDQSTSERIGVDHELERREFYYPTERAMTTKDKATGAPKVVDEDEAKDFGWESNKDDENPEHLPWPEENESNE